MARVGTTNLDLGMWADGENPGAGSQAVDNPGLNGNFKKIDTALGAEHNVNGTHKDNKIDKNHLKTTVADGSTIEKDASVGLRVKDGGITAAKLATGIKRPYKSYAVILTQSGVGAPVATVLENGLSGAIVWSRDGVGRYTGTLSGAFTNLKTIAFIGLDFYGSGGWASGYRVVCSRANDNTVTLAQNDATNAPQDVFTCYLEIRVYD